MNSEDAKTKREAAGLINLDMSIPQMIEKVASEFCDKYCKYPEQWDEEKEGCELCVSDICKNCSLNRL